MNSIQYIVCLVDDDRIYHFTARKMLESTGLTKQIQSFYDGSEAFFYLNDPGNTEQLPDVIFLDINMPVMNGWDFLEVYQQLSKTLPKHIRIYVVSSSVDSADVRRSEIYDTVTGYIIKPVGRNKYEELLKAMQTGD
ncbi:MAG: response regulator [Sediminibacterium sp.]